MGKKNNFDPLGGSISGGGISKSKKSKKSKKPDLLDGGSGRAEMDLYRDDYYNTGSSYSGVDALTPSGERREKPKKKGFLSGLFGGGKKSSKKSEPETYPEVPKAVPKREPELKITGEGLGEDVVAREEDLFEEEEIPLTSIQQMQEREVPDEPPVPVQALEPEPFYEPEPIPELTPPPSIASHQPKPFDEPRVVAPPQPVHKPSESNDPTVCKLCGEKSEMDHQYFTIHPGVLELGNSIPLCKTCHRAVSTLMKHRGPEEDEICDEWSQLCPNLDEELATDVVLEARKYH